MDYSTIIAVVIAVAAIYLFIKMVVSPLFKALLGIVFFISVIYILQHFFNIDFSSLLSPLNKYFTNWGIFNPFNYLGKTK